MQNGLKNERTKQFLILFYEYGLRYFGNCIEYAASRRYSETHEVLSC